MLASNAAGFAEGDWVQSYTGWQTHARVHVGALKRIDPDLAPVTTALGVPGIASGAAKCDWLRDTLGADWAIDYKAFDNADALGVEIKRLTDGIDVYFDNLGGMVSDAVIPLINHRDGRRELGLLLSGVAFAADVRDVTHGEHGMVLFGGKKGLYASHLPMFHAPHDYQVILQLHVADAATDAGAIIKQGLHQPNPAELAAALHTKPGAMNGTIYFYTDDLK
ncbi:hypothetical protein [Duganella sp. BuS-21]|uniref:hypothetical protein n=1 Tax=Duganella sp. BuS-21 TaxID=2943848 RepID=UPI0035A642B8